MHTHAHPCTHVCARHAPPPGGSRKPSCLASSRFTSPCLACQEGSSPPPSRTQFSNTSFPLKVLGCRLGARSKEAAHAQGEKGLRKREGGLLGSGQEGGGKSRISRSAKTRGIPLELRSPARARGKSRSPCAPQPLTGGTRWTFKYLGRGP